MNPSIEENEYAGICQHLNKAEDCSWLAEVHLPSDAPDFKSFTLWGNEDAPSAVWLYEGRFPLFNEQPVAKFRQNWETGDLYRVAE